MIHRHYIITKKRSYGNTLLWNHENYKKQTVKWRFALASRIDLSVTKTLDTGRIMLYKNRLKTRTCCKHHRFSKWSVVSQTPGMQVDIVCTSLNCDVVNPEWTRTSRLPPPTVINKISSRKYRFESLCVGWSSPFVPTSIKLLALQQVFVRFVIRFGFGGRCSSQSLFVFR